MTQQHLVGFCFGVISMCVLEAFVMWLGGRLRRAAEYAPEVPLTRDELAARRERLAASLIAEGMNPQVSNPFRRAT